MVAVEWEKRRLCESFYDESAPAHEGRMQTHRRASGLEIVDQSPSIDTKGSEGGEEEANGAIAVCQLTAVWYASTHSSS